MKDPAMEFLGHELLGNTVARGLIALCVFLVTLVVLVWLRRGMRGDLGKWLSSLPGSLDDILVATLSSTHSWYLFALSLYVAGQVLHLPEQLDTQLRLAVLLLTFVQAGLWVQRAVHQAAEIWSTKTKGTDPSQGTLSAAIRFITNLVVWSIVLLLVLQNLGVKIGALAAGLGVGGVAAALALQTVLSDLFASLSIYIDRPFDIGDFIIVDDYLGTVQKVGLRTTRLLSLGGEHLVLPNADITSSRIRNYRRMTERRIVSSFGVAYDTPYELVKAIPDMLRDIIQNTDGVRFDRAHFQKYGDAGLLFEYVYYVLSPDYSRYMDAQQAINLEILRRFQEASIRFAFPTRTLHVYNQSA
jgi:small-conductance mechanosensitive channel